MSSNRKPSEEWLRLFRSGDPKLLGTIYFEQALRIRNLLRIGFTFSCGSNRTVRFEGISSSSELDCALQEIFRRAFEIRTREMYDGSCPFSTYLSSIARNYAINTLRDREVPYDLENMDDVVETSLTSQLVRSPEQELELSQLKEVIDRFKENCNQQERQVIIHRYEQGLSQRKTARKLKRSRYWLHRLESRLRKRLVVLLEENGVLQRSEGDLK
jgi:RNA polymerase sigma factor (sigma-70 family)